MQSIRCPTAGLHGGMKALLQPESSSTIVAVPRSTGCPCNCSLSMPQGLNGSGEARTWLLPLLRSHVSGARLAFWASELLPAARLCGRRAAAAAEGGPMRAIEATQCRALELQLWATLPSFCSWPADTDTALRCVCNSLDSFVVVVVPHG